VLVSPTLFLAPTKRVSYPAMDSLTPSRLKTESGLESRDATSDMVLKVFLLTSRLKEIVENILVKRRCTTMTMERVPMMRRRPGWVVAASTSAEIMMLRRSIDGISIKDCGYECSEGSTDRVSESVISVVGYGFIL